MRFQAVFILFFCMVSVVQLYAGDVKQSSGDHNFWLSLGIGKSYFGPTFNTSISYTFNNSLVTLRYLKADEFRFNVEGHYDEPALKIREVGMLYGMFNLEKHVRLSLSVGIGYINGVDRGGLLQYHDYKKIQISTIGIPAELNIQAEFSRNFGIGFTAFGNFNKQNFFYGGIIKILLGKFSN